jgi:glycosyltransferase involved in cell wall biosynthesis
MTTTVCAHPTLKRLLVLAYWYPPENASGAQRPYRFVKYLQAYGYESEIVTASPASPGAVQVALQPNGWSVPAVLSRALRCTERVLPYADRLAWAPLAAAAVERRPGVILSTSPPVATHVAGWLLKQRFGVPWVADFRDPLYDNPFRSRAWGRPYDRALEALIFARADAIIANTDKAAEAMRRRHPAAASRVHLLWNGYDPGEALAAAPIPPRPFRTLVHLGSLYGGRHPGLLISSLRRLTGGGLLDPGQVRLRLIGPVEPGQAWMAGCSGDAAPAWLDCRNTTVSRAAAQREMSESDYLLLLDLNERGAGVQVPAKLFEYVRIGRPILAVTSRDSSSARILAASGVPYVCIFDTDSEAEVDCKMLDFFRLPPSVTPHSESFAREFDAVAQTSRLDAILSSVS